MLRSAEYENAPDSIRVKREFASNVTDESEIHLEKQFDPRISTPFGIKIDRSDDSKNAHDSIRASLDGGSNEMDERFEQPEKHDEQTSLTF
jgi:hypothetical protein